jgi:hypothetical protein
MIVQTRIFMCEMKKSLKLEHSSTFPTYTKELGSVPSDKTKILKTILPPGDETKKLSVTRDNFATKRIELIWKRVRATHIFDDLTPQERVDIYHDLKDWFYFYYIDTEDAESKTEAVYLTADELAKYFIEYELESRAL